MMTAAVPTTYLRRGWSLAFALLLVGSAISQDLVVVQRPAAAADAAATETTDLCPDRSVTPNDIRERRALDVGDLRRRKAHLIPVSIAASQSIKLELDHVKGKLADMSAVERILRQDSDPKIDVVDIRVDRRQAGLSR